MNLASLSKFDIADKIKPNAIDGVLGSGWIAKIKNPFNDISKDNLQFTLAMKSVSEKIYS